MRQDKKCLRIYAGIFSAWPGSLAANTSFLLDSDYCCENYPTAAQKGRNYISPHKLRTRKDIIFLRPNPQPRWTAASQAQKVC